MPPTPPPNQAQMQTTPPPPNDSITQQLQQTSQIQPPVKKEGFQSYQNPYNSPSPSISQAYEFRLGRKSLTDEVLGFMQK
jgi:hypothetical protein